MNNPANPDAALKAERDAAHAAALARLARLRTEREKLFPDILPLLRDSHSRFFRSLADQLADGPLTEKQALCVARLLAGERTEVNAAAFDAIRSRCMTPTTPIATH